MRWRLSSLMCDSPTLSGWRYAVQVWESQHSALLRRPIVTRIRSSANPCEYCCHIPQHRQLSRSTWVNQKSTPQFALCTAHFHLRCVIGHAHCDRVFVNITSIHRFNWWFCLFKFKTCKMTWNESSKSVRSEQTWFSVDKTLKFRIIVRLEFSADIQWKWLKVHR